MSIFDLAGPLPKEGATTVLEASAGTGKTHAIATLATRYVADGVPLEEIMLVTFGRAATAELRERVRERMTATAQALADPEAWAGSEDPVLRLLLSGTAAEIATRRRNLDRGLANFDAATISTTHGFCSHMLQALGVAADVDREVTFVDSATELVTETVNDLYVQAFGQAGSGPAPFGFKVATEVGLTAVGDRVARLEPAGAEPGTEPHWRTRLAGVVRQEVEERKRRGRIQDYDDLLVHLRDAVRDPSSGAAERIRRRYHVVLVDEFQDTDEVQWEILHTAFHGTRTLVLIGDPKQAIYAFRGADVQTYLLAAGESHEQRTLGTNWRSDRALLDSLELVMGGVALGDPRITVGPVEAAHEERRLVGAPVDAPFRIRQVTRDHVPPKPGGHWPPVAGLREHVAQDVAQDIVRLLDSRALLTHHGGQAPVQPGDIAVIVRRNQDGVTVRDALVAAGVPVVLTGTSSVFGSEAAREWLTLLVALEQRQRPGLGRTAALTSFVGWSAERLAGATDAELDEHSARLRHWAEILEERGVAALLEAVTSAAELAPRVLNQVGGERHLTDLRHIGQALHLTAVQGELGVASLVQWLRHRIEEAGRDQDDERSRRLESDAAAVQVVTVHKSKGLEFPIVYAPYLWDRVTPYNGPGTLLLHEGGQRVRDVGGPQGPGWKQRLAQHELEDADEDLRLAYVALTRARSQVVTWWAPGYNTRNAPLHRMLVGVRREDGSLPANVPVDDTRTQEAFARVAAGGISVERADVPAFRRWSPPPAPAAALAARRFDRALDLTWVRTSYSGLTAGLHEAAHAEPGVTSEAESPGTVDEPDVLAAEAVAPPDAMVSPMAALPVGAAFGTLVHEVLEHVDFSSPDLRAALVQQCEAVGSERYAGVPAETLAEALLPSLLTPLGPLAGGVSLSDLSPKDVLAEMEYEYPLAGGDRPHAGQATVGQIGELLARHLTPADPLHAYAADLAVPALLDKPLRGFLGGFLDAILRVRRPDGTPSYLVVDYKTNWLGSRESLTSWDYRPDALATAMREAHYPLQSLLYAVALHRFLRWRQPGYDPEVHLGGVLYLFVRGMCGPDTPAVDGVPAGVFSWKPPAALVTELSDLLDGSDR